MSKRRDFVKNSLLATAGIAGLGSVASLYGATGRRVSPSDIIRVALIGGRNMGWSNLETFLKFPQVECVSLCDIDDVWLDKRTADTEKISGKRPPQIVKDWRRVMDNPDVDAVIIGTPDHWHCLQAIAAMEAGKDVYCEKPLANSIAECDAMVRAARKHKRVVQTGQWQRSDPHWQDAVAFIHSGKLGRIRTVKVWAYMIWKKTLPVQPDGAVPAGVDYDMWLGPARHRPFNPNRFHYNFRYFWDYAGGLMSDWGVHLLDYALLGMKADLPKAVYTAGGKFAYPDDAMETPDTLLASYVYDDFTISWDHACGINDGPYGREHGLAFIGENGTLLLDRNGWEVIPEVDSAPRMEAVPLTKKSEQIEGQAVAGGGLASHVANFLECMSTRNLPNADVEIGARVAKMTHLANISCRLGKPVTWDNASNMFGEADANALITPYYNEPWKFPKY
ncbi:MAG: Gfo/Idh/MocA family protein [Bacteroidales bacterium]|jgi:predicted dehydrogenase|nr:Gfo/Idh/MocA family oxidoreductase [Bacteroidales bacterium]